MKLPEDKTFVELWESFRDLQKEYVINLQSAKTKKEAAKLTGISKHTPYNWDNRDEVELAAEILQEHTYEVALSELRDSAFTAVRKLIKMLKDDDLRPDLKLQVIKQILNRSVGDAALPSPQQESNHNISIKVENNED